MKAVVIGVTGTIGGAVADALAARGHEVVRGIRLNAVSPGWVRETRDTLGMDPDGGTPARGCTS